MAKPSMDLTTFIGKLLEEQDGDILRDGVRVLAQALMETEVAGRLGAERHERTDERTGYRNGVRLRTWDTRVGTIQLAIPKVRPGTYFPSLLQPRRRAEQALLAVVQEAYVHGVSTRKVDELLRALGLDGVSKSEVSRICSELDPLVEAFRTRPLEAEHPYVWLDATYHKVRIDGRVVSQATVVAIAAPFVDLAAAAQAGAAAQHATPPLAAVAGVDRVVMRHGRTYLQGWAGYGARPQRGRRQPAAAEQPPPPLGAAWGWPAP